LHLSGLFTEKIIIQSRSGVGGINSKLQAATGRDEISKWRRSKEEKRGDLQKANPADARRAEGERS